MLFKGFSFLNETATNSLNSDFESPMACTLITADTSCLPPTMVNYFKYSKTVSGQYVQLEILSSALSCSDCLLLDLSLEIDLIKWHLLGSYWNLRLCILGLLGNLHFQHQLWQEFSFYRLLREGLKDFMIILEI